ncbi:MAG: DNA polymerase III subunit alpha [Sandaracinaceae bacterium]|nr:DNA polymerase III subunit alpha [Sandaracinaceae bacterium]
MPGEFVHLHVHSEFSMLDGAVRLNQLVDQTAKLGMGAIALTDHGNMFGTVQMHKLCEGKKVKPIVGCEVNITPGHRGDPNDARLHHLVLLAENQKGYENLVRLVSLGWVEGLTPLGQPRIDFELLAKYSAGLVGLSGCMGGYLAQAVLMNGPAAGRDAMAKLRDCFPEGRFYVELQDHGFPENRPLNNVLGELARDLGLPLVATNDCHYHERGEAPGQLVLQCIGAGRSLREMEAMHHNSSEMYVKSPEQMVELFRDVPGAARNTLQIAEMCAGQVSPLSDPKLPRFKVPGGDTEEAYLADQARRGLEVRLADMDRRNIPFERKVYEDCLEVETQIINQMGFPGYFLIVQDFINWAKDNDVPVGPGRGSGAGSLVAYSLRITDLDPLPYGLLFERFLNPERVSMPDFDIDFCMDKRELVIDYVRDTYGKQSVGQIATFHQLKSKSVVKDVGRVKGLSPGDAARIAALIPDPIAGKSTPIYKALEEVEALKTLYDTDPAARDVLDIAQGLENLTRHAGMHAAGVVMSEGPIWDHVPVFCPDEGVYVTQYHKDDVEAAGLVKFDFLGLRTLTVLDKAVRLINRRPDRQGEFDLSALPLDDRGTYALLCSGETTNVFQLESTGMQDLFKKLKPDCFEDIVAAVALYRPGPMGAGMHNDFVERKHGRQRVEYPHPSVEPILRDTRGVIVYQEQVMQIAQVMGGYSLGGADLLRRAMGKKKESEMAKHKATFVDGADKNGVDKKTAEDIFDLMAFFAGYGFNKSHSAAYALITYQTAYLKAHFPVEFTCATLSADKEKSDKVVRTVAEARSMGITVLPPDVNESEIDFSVVYSPEEGRDIRRPKDKPVCQKGVVQDPQVPRIRFGLGAIKGVGSAALDTVFESRQDDAHKQDPFIDLFDFCARVDLRRVNKAVVEALIQCGAFDGVHAPKDVSRARAFAALEQAIERGKRLAAEQASGQTSLFGLLGESDTAKAYSRSGGTFPAAEDWDSRDQLQREKASLGFYVSGHPLDRYAAELRRFCNADTETLASIDVNTTIVLGGSVEAYRERRTKRGDSIAFFELEDAVGRVEVIVRPKILEQGDNRDRLKSGEPVLLTGRVQFERDRMADDDAPEQPKLVLNDVQLLASALAQKTTSVVVQLSVGEVSRQKLQALRTTLEAHPGPCPVALTLSNPQVWSVDLLETGLHVEPTDGLLASLERLFGRKACELRWANPPAKRN